MNHPNLSGGRGGGLLGRASLHHVAGGALANGVNGCHAKVIVGVRAEAAHAVACRGNAINLFVGILRAFGTVLKGKKRERQNMCI